LKKFLENRHFEKKVFHPIWFTKKKNSNSKIFFGQAQIFF